MKTKLGFFCAMLMALLVLYGCSKDNDEGGTQPSVVELDQSQLAFEAEENQQSVVVTANGDWTVSGADDWCDVQPEHGGEGETTVTIVVKANTTDNDRSCLLTFSCGTAKTTLEVVQYAPVNTHYVDVGFDDTEHVTLEYYDENSGEVRVRYADGMSLPQVKTDDVVILPYSNNYESMIRLVKSASVQGNVLTLQTDRGTMSNLFENMEFALTTNPALTADETAGPVTRSGKPMRVITPQSISVRFDNGTRQMIYDRNADARNICNASGHVGFHKDFNGKTLYEGAYGKLYWETCSFDLGLDSYIYFWYGDNYLAIDNIWGFQYYVEGNLNIDMLLKYVFESSASSEVDRLVAANIVPIEVVFSVGNVPVVVDIRVDLRSNLRMNAEAAINAEAGFYLDYMLGRVGLNWHRDNVNPPQPIRNFGKPSYGLHDPMFNAQGSFQMKGGFYPRIYVMFYKLMGPWLSLVPFSQLDLEAGMQFTGSGNDQFMGWKADFGVGLGYNLGIDWAFRKADEEPWSYADGIQDIEGAYQNLFTAPYTVSLHSPQNGTPLSVGSPAEVQFRVAGYSPLTPEEDYNCPLAVVCLESASGGELSEEFVVTDKDGIASVTWTPKDVNDKLVARIVDKEGEEISSTEFVPMLQGYDLQLVSHQDGDLLESNHPVEVAFRVLNKDAEGNAGSPAQGIDVAFSNGSSSISDEQGLVTVSWNPSVEELTLTAYAEVTVTDAEGNPTKVRMAECTFTPTLIQTTISLLSPQDGYALGIGEETEVTFLVQYTANGQTQPQAGRSVSFTSGDGLVGNAESDAAGKVSVNWAPAHVGDALMATVWSQDGSPLTGATFTPVIKDNCIKLVSPGNGQQLVEGEPVTVTFQAYASPGDEPLAGEDVTFSQQGGGQLSATSAVTDAQGNVSVVWTPEKDATLTATLVSNGAKAVFTPSWGEPTLVGTWNWVYYKAEGDEGNIPPSMSMVLNFAANGQWSISFRDSLEPDANYTDRGIAWEIKDNILYLTYEGGYAVGYTHIKSLTEDELITYNTEEGYEEFRFERVKEGQTKTTALSAATGLPVWKQPHGFKFLMRR